MFNKLLSPNDPEPISIIKNSGNIIFTGPHNGRAVPERLRPYMGMDQAWFENAHDAVDLHIAELFDDLIEMLPNASFISGNYSRLVTDLNSWAGRCLKKESSENNDIIIPENHSDKCSPQQQSQRIREIHEPYHAAKRQLISEVRKKHNGVIVLDLHSFTPTWQGKARGFELGTIRHEKTPFSRAFERYLNEGQADFSFKSGEPYRAADIESNAAPLITHINDIQYLGLEIRNDLIANKRGRAKIISLIKDSLRYLKNHPEYDSHITQRRNDVISEKLSIAPELIDSCVV